MLEYLIWTAICLAVLFISFRNMYILDTGSSYRNPEYTFDKLAFPRWVYLILFGVGIIPYINIIIALFLFPLAFLIMFFITDDGVPCLWRFHIRNKIFNKLRDFLNKEV